MAGEHIISVPPFILFALAYVYGVFYHVLMIECTISKAAKLLGVSRQAVQYKIRKNQIDYKYKNVKTPVVLFTPEEVAFLTKK